MHIIINYAWAFMNTKYFLIMVEVGRSRDQPIMLIFTYYTMIPVLKIMFNIMLM